jgi:putative addiction module killer protein
VGNVEPYHVENYKTEDGEAPYEKWLDGLRDIKTRGRIEAQIGKLRLGNRGHWDSVGGGVYELILDFGPGYRIYFARIGSVVILLLCGGDKGTQGRDIAAAKKYLRDYQARSQEDEHYAKSKQTLQRAPFRKATEP